MRTSTPTPRAPEVKLVASSPPTSNRNREGLIASTPSAPCHTQTDYTLSRFSSSDQSSEELYFPQFKSDDARADFSVPTRSTTRQSLEESFASTETTSDYNQAEFSALTSSTSYQSFEEIISTSDHNQAQFSVPTRFMSYQFSEVLFAPMYSPYCNSPPEELIALESSPFYDSLRDAAVRPTLNLIQHPQEIMSPFTSRNSRGASAATSPSSNLFPVESGAAHLSTSSQAETPQRIGDADRRLQTRPSFCRFCYKNGETMMVYESHSLKDAEGKIICPILRNLVCDLCGATGDDAHTRKHCSLYVEERYAYSPVFRKLPTGKLTLNKNHK